MIMIHDDINWPI